MTNVIQLRPTAPRLVPYTGIGHTRRKKPRTMAGLIRLHSKQVDEFNSTDHRTDAEFDAHATATYTATLHEMRDTPVRTAKDAVALIEFMWNEDLIEEWAGTLEGFSRDLLDSLCAYIKREGVVS